MKLQFTTLMMILVIFINAQMGDYYIPQNKNNLIRNELKGNVKYTSTTEWKMVVKFGDPVKSTKVKTSEDYYGKTGNYEKRIFTGDEYEGKRTYTYFYNKKDLIEEIKITPLKNYPTRFTFLYNDEGKIIEKNQYSKKNELNYKDKYKYGNYGPTSIAQYEGNGNLYSKKEYEWNSKSQKMEENEFGSKEEPLKMTSYAYNGNGDMLWFSEVEKKPGKEITEYEYDYFYNSKNQKIKTSSDYDGYKVETLYTYDANENLTKREKKYPKDKEFSFYDQYTYTYDSTGNWLTELHEFLNDAQERTFELREREIKYW